MTQNWTWTGRYILAIVSALVLGAVIGEMPVFHQATLGTSRLTAASLVKFLGYSGALGLLWLLCQRAAYQLRTASGKIAFIGMILVPLAALIIVSSAYGVLLLILKPFLDPTVRNIYNWLFVVAITASALWLVTALFHHSEPLMDLFKSSVGHKSNIETAKCGHCDIALTAGAKFCHTCGHSVF